MHEDSQSGCRLSGFGDNRFPERLRNGETATANPTPQPLRVWRNADTSAIGDERTDLESEHAPAVERHELDERHDRFRFGQSRPDTGPLADTRRAGKLADTRGFLRHSGSRQTRLCDQSSRSECRLRRCARISSGHGSQRSLHGPHFPCPLSTPVFRREIPRRHCHSLRT